MDGHIELLYQYPGPIERFFCRNAQHLPVRPNPTHSSPVPLPSTFFPSFPFPGPTTSAMQLRGQKLIRDSNPDFQMNVDLGVCQIGVMLWFIFHDYIEIHTTRACLPTLSYYSKCCNFSLDFFLTTYDKVCPGRAGPGRFLGLTRCMRYICAILTEQIDDPWQHLYIRGLTVVLF